ncbi:MAG: hypothetical protein ACLFTK_07460 [Anaerolineales bacterium]
MTITDYDARQLMMIVAHAARHLHATVRNCSTALLDTHGKGHILFSNSALSHMNGDSLLQAAQHYAHLGCETPPCLHTQDPEADTRAYFIVLNGRHVFVIVGRPTDELRVQAFHERLTKLLPSSVG